MFLCTFPKISQMFRVTMNDNDKRNIYFRFTTDNFYCYCLGSTPTEYSFSQHIGESLGDFVILWRYWQDSISFRKLNFSNYKANIRGNNECVLETDLQWSLKHRQMKLNQEHSLKTVVVLTVFRNRSTKLGQGNCFLRHFESVYQNIIHRFANILK